MAGNVIIPAPPVADIERLIRSQYEIWRTEYLATLPKFKIENVRFRHDPKWNKRFWSITYIRSGESYFWNGVAQVFWLSQQAWWIAPILVAAAH